MADSLERVKVLNEFKTSNKEFVVASATSVLVYLLTHFRPAFHFYAPRFSGGLEKDRQLEIGY